jgi:hypothetical protein
VQVRPDPHFRPRDIKALDYPTDNFVVTLPIYQSVLEALRPIKAQYEQAMYYDMRRYKVFEPEIPASIALRNKRRKRAKQTELTVSFPVPSETEFEADSLLGTSSRILHCACTRISRCSTSCSRGIPISDDHDERTDRSSTLLCPDVRERVRGRMG